MAYPSIHQCLPNGWYQPREASHTLHETHDLSAFDTETVRHGPQDMKRYELPDASWSVFCSSGTQDTGDKYVQGPEDDMVQHEKQIRPSFLVLPIGKFAL
jgi:hypothetical protein